MDKEISFQDSIEFIKKSNFDIYANIKFDLIMNMYYNVAIKLYSHNNTLNELLEYFESTEEFEKCKDLLRIKTNKKVF